jgi:hypothetical protein
MKIIIPVSKSDVHLLPKFTEVLVHHGNLHQHSILVAPTVSVEAEAYAAAAELRGICPVVDVHSVPDFDGGWPQAPNQHWAHVAMYLDSSGNSHPWFWMELDTVPLQSNWADALQREYNQCGKPLLGVVVPTLGEAAGDTTMLGVAVYPSYVKNLVNMAPLFNDLLKAGDQSVKEPFDHYLRWVFARAGVAHTEVIQDQWDTGEYVSDGSNYVGKPLESRDGRNRSGIVPQSALLVHGCKDDSLMRMVLGESGEPKPFITTTDELESMGYKLSDITMPLHSSSTFKLPPQVAEDAVLAAIATLDNEQKRKVYDILGRLLFQESFVAVVEPEKQPEPEPPQPELPKSRFILGPVTPEEEAAFACSKAEFLEWFTEQKKKPRLREMQEKFGYKNLDAARRAIKHWGYQAPTPHTFISKIK